MQICYIYIYVYIYTVYTYHRSKIKEIRAAYGIKQRSACSRQDDLTRRVRICGPWVPRSRFMAKTVPSPQPIQTLLSTGGLEMMFFQTKVWFSGSILVGIWNKYLEFMFFSFSTPPKFPLIRTSQSWSRFWGNHPKKWIFVPWSKIYVLVVGLEHFFHILGIIIPTD